jgi:hypothetical protein
MKTLATKTDILIHIAILEYKRKTLELTPDEKKHLSALKKAFDLLAR